jgi:two-component system nitrate/nitrite response regulator NarL
LDGIAVREPTRVVLASNNILFRDCLSITISNETEMEVSDITDVTTELTKVITRALPAIVIIDLDEATDAATALLATVTRIVPEARLVLLGRSDEPAFVREMMRLGVCCYLTTGIRHEDFLLALRVMDTSHQSALMMFPRGHQPGAASTTAATAHELLSSREQQILELVAEALTNSQIARKLGIAEKTVKRHLSNIFAKLNAVSRMDAVNKAMMNGAFTGSAGLDSIDQALVRSAAVGR